MTQLHAAYQESPQQLKDTGNFRSPALADDNEHNNRESALTFKNTDQKLPNLDVDVNLNFMPNNLVHKLYNNPTSIIATEILSPISLPKEMEAVATSPKFTKEPSELESSSSFSKKKQVRFTNVYDIQNLNSMKNMRMEKMNQFNRILEEKKKPSMAESSLRTLNSA